jgi:hypothetical protein
VVAFRFSVANWFGGRGVVCVMLKLPGGANKPICVMETILSGPKKKGLSGDPPGLSRRMEGRWRGVVVSSFYGVFYGWGTRGRPAYFFAPHVRRCRLLTRAVCRSRMRLCASAAGYYLDR